MFNVMIRNYTEFKDVINNCNRLLSMDYIDFEKEGIEQRSTIYSTRIDFGNVYVEIEVLTGLFNAYISATLKNVLTDKILVVLDQVYETLDGTYEFHYGNERYVVNIEKNIKEKNHRVTGKSPVTML